MTKLTRAEYDHYSDQFNGKCLACDAWHFGGIEGDAEGYECDYCGESQVMGMLNLLFEGKIDVV